MKAATLVCAFVALATGAAAQSSGVVPVSQGIESSPWEATAAVLFADFRKDPGEQQTFPDFGWSLSVGASVGAWVALVGEADGYANGYDVPIHRQDRVGLLRVSGSGGLSGARWLVGIVFRPS